MYSQIVNTAILFFGVILMLCFFKQLREINYTKDDLYEYKGVVVKKLMAYEKDDDKISKVLYLTMSNNSRYRVSKYVTLSDQHVETGDTVQVYTYPETGSFGKFVSNEDGSRISITREPNEVFELYSIKDQLLIFGYEEHRSNLKKLLWLPPLFSFCMFAWFWYRKSGIKSPLVMQTDD